MQFVILCGGLGSRAQSFSKGKPKSMIEFLGKPFIDYSISNLISQGISRFVLCVGKGGESIAEYCEKHFSSKVEILFSWEEDHLLGTGGAVKKAKYLLDDEFLLSYGDAYVLIDVQNFIYDWKNRKDCVMS